MTRPQQDPAPSRPNHASRRMFLRGVGVTMALPWLESIPAGRGVSAIASSGSSSCARLKIRWRAVWERVCRMWERSVSDAGRRS